MKEQFLVSIVIPTYNRADLIVRTLKSILNQNAQNFEVLIIDDGSTDNTEEVVAPFLSERVRYFKIENGERGRARNHGTKLAKGKYINWFDSDDVQLENHVQEVEKAIIKFDSPPVITLEYEIRDAQLKFIRKANFLQNKSYDILIDGNYLACNPVIVRKDIALENLFIEDRKLSASEDYELWLRIRSQFKFAHHPVCTSFLIQHDFRSVNTMSNASKLETRFLTFLDITCENEKILSFLGDKKAYFRMKNYLILAVDLAYQRHKKKAIHYLKKAFSEDKKAIFNSVFWATLKHIIF